MRAQTERHPRHEAFNPSWRIFRQWGMTKAYLGVVEAPDKVSALQRAIRMFRVLSPEHQKHLVVEPRTL
jgi:hypothetical protein